MLNYFVLHAYMASQQMIAFGKSSYIMEGFMCSVYVAFLQSGGTLARPL